MTPARVPLALLLCLMILGPALAGDASGHTSELFNGRDLHGWVVTGCKAGVEDGLLVLQEGNGFVRTEHRYADFVLELDWRARRDDKWDSGIYFRAELPPEGRPWPRRYQANLLKGQEGAVGGLEGATSGTGLVKPGAWNTFKLTAVGETARLEINGQEAWQAEGLEAAAGYIGLQAEVPGGGQFEFRNVRITELGYAPLFNGQDLSGWEAASGDASACWTVRDGTLMCTGQRGTWLRSKAQYGDFNLRLEYKLAAGGNSGVYVRVPENGDHRGDRGQKDAGVEVQILHDAAPKYQKLKPYQFTGSVYAIAPATQHVGRPPGAWNSLEIDCRGTRYRVTHNGVVIVDAREEEFEALKHRRLRGFLGLQNHNTQVWFRNLRIGPPLP